MIGISGKPVGQRLFASFSMSLFYSPGQIVGLAKEQGKTMSFQTISNILDGCLGWWVYDHSSPQPWVYAHILKAPFLTYFLTTLCFTNTIYTFSRKRYYRLFESALDVPPSTPSASRVRVLSSPLSSCPLGFLSSILTIAGTASRLHPETGRDVWELAVWDPKPFCLKLFCYLSPGHALVYWLFLPAAPEDPRPIVTAMTAILLATLLSVQLKFFQLFFSQQLKDTAIIHKEVINEYDIKYVHPRTRPKVRDVGTQLSMPDADAQMLSQGMDNYGSVDTYTPTTILNKGFRIHPNPAYAKLVNQEVPLQRMQASRDDSNLAPLYETPVHQSSSLIRPSTVIRPLHSRSIRTGDGGSLGIYSHVQSPLRKGVPNNFVEEQRQVDRGSSPVKRELMPMKRASMQGLRGINREGLSTRRGT